MIVVLFIVCKVLGIAGVHAFLFMNNLSWWYIILAYFTNECLPSWLRGD